MTKYNLFNRRFERVGAIKTDNRYIELEFVVKKGLMKEFDQHLAKFFKKNRIKITSPSYSKINNHRNMITTKTKRFDIYVIKNKLLTGEKFFYKVPYKQPKKRREIKVYDEEGKLFSTKEVIK